MLKLNLVLFTDALMHLMRISRLMAMARGSGLLVGVGGSGKQSLARLSAYISGAYTFQITVTKARVIICPAEPSNARICLVPCVQEGLARCWPYLYLCVHLPTCAVYCL